MTDELRINRMVWQSALADLPFKQLAMLVSDVKGRIWSITMEERENPNSKNDAFWELFDLLHSAIQSKWSFKEHNIEGIRQEKIEKLAHDLNMEYLTWHPERWPQYENDPKYKKEIAALKREKLRRKPK